MVVLATTHAGSEYLYNPRTAHHVSERNARKIRDALNAAGYRIRAEFGETWHVYTVDAYDTASEYAQFQKFTLSKTGTIRETRR